VCQGGEPERANLRVSLVQIRREEPKPSVVLRAEFEADLTSCSFAIVGSVVIVTMVVHGGGELSDGTHYEKGVAIILV